MVMSVMSAIVSFVMLIAMLVAASTEYAFCHHSCSAAYCTTICDGQVSRQGQIQDFQKEGAQKIMCTPLHTAGVQAHLRAL